MLQNAYFLAKIGAATAENEQHFAEILPIGRRGADRCPPYGGAPSRAGPRRGPSLPRRALHPPRRGPWRRMLGARVSKIGKITKILQILGGLVLGCIKTKFCKKTCVWQNFSSSTRFAYFCTAAISKFSQKIGLKFQQFSWKTSSAKICKFFKICKFAQVSKNSAR